MASSKIIAEGLLELIAIWFILIKKCVECKDLCTTLQLNSQAEAQMQCPQFCAGTQMSWNGQYQCNKHFWQGRTCPNDGCLCGCENRPLGPGMGGMPGMGGFPGMNGGNGGGTGGMTPFVTAPQIIALPKEEDDSGGNDMLPLMMLPMMMGGFGGGRRRQRDDDDLLPLLMMMMGGGGGNSNGPRRFYRRRAYDDVSRLNSEPSKAETSVPSRLFNGANSKSTVEQPSSAPILGSLSSARPLIPAISVHSIKTAESQDSVLQQPDEMPENIPTSKPDPSPPVNSAFSLEAVLNQAKKKRAKLQKLLEKRLTSNSISNVAKDSETFPAPSFSADSTILQ